MKTYFEKFPTITYPYTDNSGKKIEKESVDLSVRFKIIEEIMKDSNSYYEYYWTDTDRVDIVADKYYGSVDFAWIVMLSSEIFDWLYDLPLTEEMFEKYLMSKYKVSNINSLRTTIHSYKDISGTIVDKITFDSLSDTNKSIVYIYEYERDINERKRSIKLLSKAHLKDIINEFDVRLRDIKNNRRLFKTQ